MDTILRYCARSCPGFLPGIRIISTKQIDPKSSGKNGKIVAEEDRSGWYAGGNLLTLPSRYCPMFKISCLVFADSAWNDKHTPTDYFGRDWGMGWRMVPFFSFQNHSPEYGFLLDFDKWRKDVPERELLKEYFETVATLYIANQE